MFAVGVPSAVATFLFDLDYVIIDKLMVSYEDLALVIAAVSIVLCEIFASQLVQIFLSDAQAAGMAAAFLRVRVLATPLMFLSFFTVYLFQAFGKGKISLFLGVVRWLGFNIPMLFILNSIFGMYGIVWSQVTADTLTVILSFYVLHRFGPKKEQYT